MPITDFCFPCISFSSIVILVSFISSEKIIFSSTVFFSSLLSIPWLFCSLSTFHMSIVSSSENAGLKIKAAKNLLPVVALIFFVLGSIYGGYATPTEAATIGVIGALILAWSSKSLSFKSFMDSLLGAVKTSCMINFIIVGAAFLSLAMGYTGIPKQLGQVVNDFQLSQLSLLAILTLLYIFLGCFLEGTSMMVLTASVVLPMVQTAGIDLIWFGIFTVIVVEMAQITPPVGFNLFVLQGMTGRDILKVTKAALPFFFLMLLSIVILIIFPQIVTAPVNFMIR